MKRIKALLAVVLSVLMVVCAIPVAVTAASASYYRVFEGATWNSGNLVSVSGSAKLSISDNIGVTHDEEYVKLATATTSDAYKTWNGYVKLNNSKMGKVTDVKAYAMFVDFSQTADWAAASTVNVTFKLLDKNGKELKYYARSNKSVTANRISSVNGTNTAVTFKANGGVQIPHGFVGWLVIPMDAPSTSFDYSTVGGISLRCVATNAKADFADTNIFFDDVYAVTNVNKFVSAVQNADLGKLTGSGDITVKYDVSDVSNKLNWTFSWNAVSGASKYVVKAYNEYGIFSGKTLTTTNTTASFSDTYFFDDSGSVQVIAYNSSGKILAISSVVNVKTLADYQKIGDADVIADNANTGSWIIGGIGRVAFGNTGYNASAFPSVSNVNNTDLSNVRRVTIEHETGSAWKGIYEVAHGIDIEEPTIKNVNGMAVWCDFSEFEYDDYWRPYLVDNTVDERNDTYAATTGNGEGSHYAYTYGRATTWTAANKTGKATLINTKTGEVITETFTNGSGGRGGFRIPAGFVGYVYYEFDNKSNYATGAGEDITKNTGMATVGMLVLHRRWNGVYSTGNDTVDGAMTAENLADTSVSNLNSYTLNQGKRFYYGNVYAVSDIDAFAKDVLSGKLGKMSGDLDLKVNFGSGSSNTVVKFLAAENATKYVVNLYSASTNELVASKTVSTTTCDFGEDLGSVYAQVDAYKGSTLIGRSIAKLNDGICNHNFRETNRVEGDCTNDGSITSTCSFCGDILTDIIPATGHPADYQWIGDTVSAQDNVNSTGNAAWGFKDGLAMPSSSYQGYYQVAGQYFTNVANPNTHDGGPAKLVNLSNQGLNNNASNNYGYAIDVHEPTIANVNGLAVWVDFSAFTHDDYWRPFVTDNTVQTRVITGGVYAIDTAITSVESAGSHTAYTLGDTTKWTAQNKTGKATLINTKTNTVNTESFTAGSGSAIGGFRVPAGFVGFIYFEFDNKNNSLDDGSAMYELGNFVLTRYNNTVATTSNDTSTANLNQQSLNGNKDYYLGDVFAVSDIDSFAADVLAKEVGDIRGGDITEVKEDATCDQDGSLKLTCSKCNTEFGVTILPKKGHNIVVDANVAADCETETNGYYKEHCTRCDYEKEETRLYSHNYVEEKKEATRTEDGYVVDKCSVCKKYDEATRVILKALGNTGVVNGAGSNAYTILGRNANSVSYLTYGSTGSNEAVWGPSLKYTRLTLNKPYGAVAASIDLKDANGLAFYVDHTICTNTNSNHNSYSCYDIAFGTVKSTNFGTAGTTDTYSFDDETTNHWVVGGLANAAGAAYGITYKLYDITTGAYTDGAFRAEKGEVCIPKTFKGYIVLDLTNFDETAAGFALDDVKQVILEKSTFTDTGSTDAKKCDIAFDNFFTIYDMTTFNSDIEGTITKVGTVVSTAGNTVTFASSANSATAGKVTETYDLTAVDGATKYVVNVYTISTDGDSYTLEATAQSATNQVSVDVPQNTAVYIQSIAYTSSGRVASELLSRTTASVTRSLFSLKPVTSNFTYANVAGGVAITGYESDNSVVVIPEYLYGNKVVAIAAEAFKNSEITEITIPEGITNIGVDAFSDCDELVKVNYNAVNAVCYGSEDNPVFPNNKGLKVVIGDTVEVVPEFLYK